MKSKFTWAGIAATLLVIITTFFVACKKDDINEVVKYHGQVVYINTTTPFPNVTVKVTNGSDIHCQTQTDDGGLFSLTVRVNEIDGNYYLLAGDETCIPKKVALGAYGQAEVDLGVIEVEGPALPTVVTHPIQSVTANSAVLGGEVQTDGRLTVTARGVCYGTNPYPTVNEKYTTDGTGLGEFSSTLKELEFKTIYYARAYATNKLGTAYGEQVKFTTEEGVAVVETDSVIRITAHSAKCKGHVESDGGFTVTKRGTCWSKRPDPTVDDDCTDDGSGLGEFTSTMKDLTENTTYYVRTYATNSTATTYGKQIIITTLDGLAVVKTDSITSVTATGFTAFGEVVSDCDIPVTSRGFCYSTMQYPTIENEHTTIGKGIGKFQSNIVNLKVGTTYYVRAYATNETATVYGEQMVVTTLDGLPSVETTLQYSSTATSITTGGKVVNNGGFDVSERGICYSTTNTEPSTSDAKITSGNGNGTYNVSITELTAATKYYVRAYATNENGTAYGNIVSITTKDGNATISLGTITNITALTATGSVTVTATGGATLQSCGICWSTNPNPTISDKKTIAGGTQLNTVYSCNISELQPNTTYYARAYATTDIATAYSAQKTFKTTTGLPTITTGTTTATSTTITSGGIISSDGGYAIEERGICYSTTNSNPTILDEFLVAGVVANTFSVVITNVTVKTSYYIRAYAKNSIGIAYGNTTMTTTGDGLPTVTTTEVTKSGSSLVTGGNVTSDGGYPVTARGVCYGQYPNPDLSSAYSHTSNGTGTGYFTSNLGSSLSGVIYVRAYATNANGTAYGKEKIINVDYLMLPTFKFNNHVYRVAPEPTQTMNYVDGYNYCNNLTLYGYSDWRLPTYAELCYMCNIKESIGGFVDDNTYYLHTEGESSLVIDGNIFSTVNIHTCSSSSSMIPYGKYHIRPIRRED